MYHVDLVLDLLLLVTQLTHDVVARVLRLVGNAVHHTQPIGLVLSLPVQVQHPLSVCHGELQL